MTQPRSAATISAMTPKPEPPIVIGSVSSRALARGAPVEGEAADGMRAFPEIAERLALHDLEQRVVRQRCELQRDLLARLLISANDLPRGARRKAAAPILLA